MESITERTRAQVQHFDSISTWNYGESDEHDISSHLEVDNEDNDLGDGRLQTEEIGVLILQGLTNHNLWHTTNTCG